MLGQVHQYIDAILVGNCLRLQMQDAVARGLFFVLLVVVAIQELKQRSEGIEVIVFEMYDTSLSFLVNDQQQPRGGWVSRSFSRCCVNKTYLGIVSVNLAMMLTTVFIAG